MEVVKKLKIHNKLITCIIQKSKKRSTLSYSLSYGQLRILVHEKVSEERMIQIIENSLPKEKVDLINNDDLVNDEYIYLLGNKRKIVVLNENQNATSFNDIVIRNRKDIDKYIEKFALEVFTERVRRYEKVMNSPYIHEVLLKNLKGVYGKNFTVTHKIVLEKRLIHFGLDIIDQTVIHEIAHDFEANHSGRFYKILKQYCPEHKEKKERLSLGVRK